MFETQITIKLHHTDAAGTVFFANHFKMAHSAYEAFMQSMGCGLHDMIEASAYLLPIVHAEARYRKPLALGARVSISMKAEMGATSFSLFYTFRDGEKDVVAELKTVHVAVDKETKQKVPLPEGLRKGLATIALT